MLADSQVEGEVNSDNQQRIFLKCDYLIAPNSAFFAVWHAILTIA